MKYCLRVLCVLVAILWSHHASSQTLNERLLKENPTKLAQEARKKGNVVRGAILFHQGNINCAKCHRAKSEKDRIGPDLSRMGDEVTDKLIIEAILEPSKIIKKGYETVSVLTNEGLMLSGMVVRQDDRVVVLRSRKNVDQIITIRRDDIDEIKPGKKSNMPDELANELKNRQQFLDLLRYVIDIRDRGPTADLAVGGSTKRRQLSDELSGLVLLGDLNCTSCHKSASAGSILKPKLAPNLKWSAKHLNPEYLARFIADPQKTKPGTTMPHALHQLNPADRKKSAEALVQYLVSLSGNQFQQKSIDKNSAHRGFELFHSVGCVACHSPRNEQAVEQPLADSKPLGNISEKYNLAALTKFLENPHAVRPSGRMPNMQLTHREAVDISSYLLQSTAAKKPVPKWKTDSALVAEGKSMFTKYHCSQCHTGIVESEPSASLTALEKLNPLRGCLSDKNAERDKASLKYQLTDREVSKIRSALKNLPTKLTKQQQIDVTLTSFNCTTCHSRGDLGGVSAARDAHFKTTNLNLGDQGRIPPTLTGVGAKLKPKWMRDVLVNRRVIRPYMKTRMPQYGEKNIGHLIELLQTTDRIADTEFAKIKNQKEMRKTGLYLAGNQGLNCVACHTYQYKISDTMPAVDLTEMAERLKKEWFYQYMLAPQKFSPNTVMPSFWPNGKAIRKDIAGTPKLQVEALWQYLIDGRQAPTPRGVIREPLEIVVTNEAKMLRRRYPGIGKRGIGVGYPGSVNLAYDAEQMRLAKIWKGKFVDPSGVWYGQGSGNVRMMGKPIDFSKSPELDDATDPWKVDRGRPPNHQFKGYVLDKVRRPAFQYRYRSIIVEDFHSEFRDKTTQQIHLRRRIKMTAQQEHKNLRFRLAEDKSISTSEKRLYAVGKKLKIRVVSDHQPKIIEHNNGKILQIPLDFRAGQVQELVIEYWWE